MTRLTLEILPEGKSEMIKVVIRVDQKITKGGVVGLEDGTQMGTGVVNLACEA